MASPSLSRRGLLTSGAAALTLVPLAARADVPVAPENIQGAPDDADRLNVQAMIDGHGPYRFLVDTGADHTVIADDVARDLGFVRSSDVIIQGITSAIPAQTVRLKNLSFGPVVVEDLVTPVLPRSFLGTDGYIGIVVINNRREVFDFQNHALTIAQPQSRWSPEHAHADEALIRVQGSGGRVTAFDCEVDGVRAQAFIDSGAETSIGNGKLFAALQANDNRKYFNEDVVWLTGVTGALAPGRLTAVQRVRLGRINFTDSALIISDLPIFDVWGLANRPAMFIGMNFLKQTSQVTIDYGRKLFRFRVADLVMARSG